MYEVVFSEVAVKEIADLKKNDFTAYHRFYRIVKILQKHPFEGLGDPHRLHLVEGIWSRDLGKGNRIRYFVNNARKRVTVISAMGHYPPKLIRATKAQKPSTRRTTKAQKPSTRSTTKAQKPSTRRATKAPKPTPAKEKE